MSGGTVSGGAVTGGAVTGGAATGGAGVDTGIGAVPRGTTGIDAGPAAPTGIEPLRRVALAPARGPITARIQDARPRSVADALDTAVRLEPLRPFVGEGSTLDVWEALATLAASDVALARAVEPHVDAVTILHQAGVSPEAGSTWGVFAAEGPETRLTATETGGSWSLAGVKPWCSLAGTLSHALVTAWVGESERRLFRVALRSESVVTTQEWGARGLTEIPSGDVTFHGTSAEPVGAPGWYLTRPGFAWGGISVAACWYGGAVGIARLLLAEARAPRRADDALLQMHLGQVDARLSEARASFAQAAALADGGPSDVRSDTAVDALTAKRVRSTVFRAAESVIRAVGHALGPAPLVADQAHAKRVADLELYLRQHHGERDDASEGRALRDSAIEW